MNEPRNLRKAYVEKLRACEISLKPVSHARIFPRKTLRNVHGSFILLRYVKFYVCMTSFSFLT